MSVVHRRTIHYRDFTPYTGEPKGADVESGFRAEVVFGRYVVGRQFRIGFAPFRPVCALGTSPQGEA